LAALRQLYGLIPTGDEVKIAEGIT
jgi:hypothetical protein